MCKALAPLHMHSAMWCGLTDCCTSCSSAGAHRSRPDRSAKSVAGQHAQQAAAAQSMAYIYTCIPSICIQDTACNSSSFATWYIPAVFPQSKACGQAPLQDAASTCSYWLGQETICSPMCHQYILVTCTVSHWCSNICICMHIHSYCTTVTHSFHMHPLHITIGIMHCFLSSAIATMQRMCMCAIHVHRCACAVSMRMHRCTSIDVELTLSLVHCYVPRYMRRCRWNSYMLQYACTISTIYRRQLQTFKNSKIRQDVGSRHVLDKITLCLIEQWSGLLSQSSLHIHAHYALICIRAHQKLTIFMCRHCLKLSHGWLAAKLNFISMHHMLQGMQLMQCCNCCYL